MNFKKISFIKRIFPDMIELPSVILYDYLFTINYSQRIKFLIENRIL